MKKIFTSISLLLMAIVSNAAVEVVSVAPASESELSSQTQTVTFEFSDTVSVGEIHFVSGSFWTRTDTVVATSQRGTTITAEILPEYWGPSSQGVYNMEVLLTNVLDANGDTIKTMLADSTYAVAGFSTYYTLPKTDAATFVKWDPSESELAVTNVYYDGWGYANAHFTNAVEISDDFVCTVTYVDLDDRKETYSVSSSDVWGDWDMDTENYVVSIPLPLLDSIQSADLYTIEVEVSGISYNGNSIDVPSITYLDPVEGTSLYAKKGGAQNPSSVKGTVKISPIELAGKTLYIVNGKKFVK